MEYEIIYHHGVKGMKWGVRRTPAQLGHKPKSKSRKKSLKFSNPFKKKTNTKVKPKIDETEDIEAKKEKVLKSRSAKDLYVNAHLFSDAELNRAYNRLNTERNIANLIPKEVNKGEEFVNKVVKTTNTVSSLVESSTKLYNNVARVYNSVTDEGKSNPLPLVRDNDKKN